MNDRVTARLLSVSTSVLIVFSFIALAGVPFVVEFLLRRDTSITSPGYVVGCSLAVYLLLPPFFMLLFCLKRIFSNVACGIVYDASNAKMLRIISIFSGIEIAFCLGGWLMVAPLFGAGAGAVCLCLLIIFSIVLALSAVFGQFLSSAINDQESGEPEDDNR